MWNKFKLMGLQLSRVPELEAFVLRENIHRLRIIAIVGGVVNIAVSIFSALDHHYSQIFFESEIYFRGMWIILSLVYIGISTKAFVERYFKWMHWINGATVSLCLIFAALVSGLPFADQSYLILYYANILLMGTLMYLSLVEIMILAIPSLGILGLLFYSYPKGVLHIESNMVNVFALTFFAFMMASMNYKLKGEQYKTLELVKRQNEELQYISNMDVLTDMPNRRKLNEALDKALRELRDEGKVFGLLMIDIDYFKNYNDTYGHLTGDECLVGVATALKEYAQNSNGFIGRFGGEEFLFILPLTDDLCLKERADKLRLAIEDLNIENKGSTIGRVTISIGAVSIDSTILLEPFHSRALLEMADKALYQAKDRGRNCSVVIG